MRSGTGHNRLAVPRADGVVDGYIVAKPRAGVVLGQAEPVTDQALPEGDDATHRGGYYPCGAKTRALARGLLEQVTPEQGARLRLLASGAPDDPVLTTDPHGPAFSARL